MSNTEEHQKQIARALLAMQRGMVALHSAISHTKTADGAIRDEYLKVVYEAMLDFESEIVELPAVQEIFDDAAAHGIEPELLQNMQNPVE